MILLDTNICVAILRREEKALKQFRKANYGDVYVPIIVRAELYYGAYLSNQKEENLESIVTLLDPLRSVEFDDRAAHVYAQLRTSLRQQGQMIGANDLVIASIALSNNFMLISNNFKEFSRVPGLGLEDWLT